MQKQAVVITWDGDVQRVEYDKKNELSFLQDTVDGYIEMVTLAGTQLTMYVNEEGKMEGLPANAKATAIFREKFKTPDYIAGDAVFTGSEKYLDKIVKLFSE